MKITSCRLILATLLVFAQSSVWAGNDYIFSDSLESTQVIEKLVDTAINNGESVTAGGVTVTSTDDVPSSVEISNAINRHMRPVIRVAVSGGSVTVDFSEFSTQSDKQLSHAEGVDACDSIPDNHPVSDCIVRFEDRFLGRIKQVDNDLEDVRTPSEMTIWTISRSETLSILELMWRDASGLFRSDCSSYSVCDGDPVLFIHGFQAEKFHEGAVLEDNGGADYWGSFPQRLMNDGYYPFEFIWLTNARFEDVAVDLRQAIESINTETGKNVHIVAHSFGGVLTRHMLQIPSLNEISSLIASVTTIGTPHSGIFDKRTTYSGESSDIDFPKGQHNLAFEGCNQISCYLMGEDVPSDKLAISLGIGANPGKAAHFLADSMNSLPSLNIQSLIGFMRDEGFTFNDVANGDGLISGEGQRFYPDLVFTATTGGDPKWESVLFKKSLPSGATVTEWFLGRNSAEEGAPHLEPNSVASDPDFVAFKHSSGTFKFPRLAFDEIEPFIKPSGFNDVYQRVVDWITRPENQTCYPLTLSHVGEGLDPVANPESSQSCDVGTYHRGETIELVAAANPGWNVAQWIGTDDDSITFTKNQVTMPAGNHAVTVSYSDALPIYIDRLATGSSHSCAVTNQGQAKCWGRGFDGQLGNGATNDSAYPSDVMDHSNGISAIAAGGSHSCSLNSAGGVACWGENIDLQLGISRPLRQSNSPLAVPDLPNGVAAISLGDSHSCALTREGAVKCWGDGTFMKLGVETFSADKSSPISVPYLESGVTSISVGVEHSCALKSSGAVWCWGRNSGGSLGNGSTVGSSGPVPVTGLNSNVKDIATGGDHSCAVLTNGFVKCWGANTFGELGDSTTSHRRNPVYVQGLDVGIKIIDTGNSHTCGLTEVGGVKCWGLNRSGQLGDGTKEDRRTPVDVSGLSSGVMDISLGGNHSCAVMDSGAIKCWGSNSSDQLGNGVSEIDALTPTDVIGFP